jgi:predicted component of type VI protein secretion system
LRPEPLAALGYLILRMNYNMDIASMFAALAASRRSYLETQAANANTLRGRRQADNEFTTATMGPGEKCQQRT